MDFFEVDTIVASFFEWFDLKLNDDFRKVVNMIGDCSNFNEKRELSSFLLNDVDEEAQHILLLAMQFFKK